MTPVTPSSIVSWLMLITLVTGAVRLVEADPATDAASVAQNGSSQALLVIENVGQFAPRARFLIRNGPATIWLADGELWLQQFQAPLADPLADRPQPRLALTESAAIRGANVRLTFAGADPSARPEPFGPQPANVSYLIGKPEDWRPSVPVWAGVTYRHLYPGVDLVVEGQNGAFSWRLEAETGTDLSAVQLRIEGAEGVSVDGDGLRLETVAGQARLPKLTIAAGLDAADGQPSGAGIPAIARLAGPVVDVPLRWLLNTGPGRPAATPEGEVGLIYSTFLGGSSWDIGEGVTVDGAGSAYVTGRTPSSDFPTTPGAFDRTLAEIDAFVVKLNATGTGLAYATFLGGSSTDGGYGIVVDGGVAYVAGETVSANFPTTAGAYDTTCGSDGLCDAGNSGPYPDAFFVKLNSTGTGLSYATFLGGSDQDTGYGIDVEAGNAYLTGISYSPDFADGEYVADGDTFVAKLTSSGELGYSTMLGGRNIEAGFAVAVTSGVAFVTGETSSPDFPASGFIAGREAFVCKLGSGGIVGYCRLLAGSLDESGYAIAVDSSQSAYVAGVTGSTNFPITEGAYGGGSSDAFVAKLNSAGTVVYGTYLGGDGAEAARGIAIDAQGGIYTGGWTDSENLPVTADAYQAALAGLADGFMCRYDLAGTAPGHIAYASYLGGSGHDYGYGLAIDSLYRAYLTGWTLSADYPTTSGAFDPVPNGRDAFVSKLSVGIGPDIRIDKATNGQDADNPPGPYIPVAQPVVWTYVVENTGDVDLHNVGVADDRGVIVSCPSTILTAGASMTCQANGTATAGQYSNVGTATGTSPAGGNISASDPSYYYGSAPAIAIEKRTNGQDADSVPGPYVPVGQPVAWTYVVQNTGNVELTSVTVTDDRGVTVNCPGTSLLPGASMTCQASGTAAAGQYGNLGTASGTPPGGLPAVSASDLSHYYGSAPAIAIEKRTNGQDADGLPGPYILVGGAVAWTYVVQNTGNVSLSSVTVTDDQGVVVSCPGATLAPGASMTCQASGTATVGQYGNMGTVTCTPPVGGQISASDASHYYGAVPAIAIEKRTNGQDADSPPGPYIPVGQPVAWTYAVQNTGNVPLSSVTVTDDRGATVSCPGATLAAGASMTCQASGTATAGQYSNLGTASGTPPGGLAAVSASDPSHYYGSVPAIAIEKRTNGQDADGLPGAYIVVGGAVAWTYMVQNTGNVPLSSVTMRDDQGVVVSCPGATLAPGASMTCQASGTATAGQYGNVGTVTGTPPVGGQVSASDPSHYFGAVPGIAIEKRTNGQDADGPLGPYIPVGQPVAWTYAVQNTGNVPLSSVTVTDDRGVTVSCPSTLLAAGASMTCQASGTATAGQYSNVGTVTGTPPGGLAAVAASDPSHYYGSAPAIAIEKRTNGLDADGPPGPYIALGRPVTWTYAVQNMGNVELTSVAVTDNRGVTVNCPGTSLLPGASMTCQASGTASAGQYGNVGTVTGTPPVGSQVSASDPSHYYGSAPAIAIEKRTNGQDADGPPGPYVPVGQPVAWTYAVQNTGNVPLSSVTVTDDRGATVSCPSVTLAAGASMTCQASGTAAAGQYNNLGTASGTPPGGLAAVSASDASHYYGAAPAIAIEKRTNGQDANSPPGPYIPVGQPVAWTYAVQNTGNVPLSSVTVTDDRGATVSCPGVTLASGASMTCQASGTAAAGQYSNVGTVSCTPPGGLAAVSASDPSHYYGSAPAIAIEKRTNGQDADSAPGPYIPVGQLVAWTYAVQNTGNVPLSSVTVTDDRGVTVSCPSTLLAAGASMTCQASGTATTGQYTNLGTATGTPPVGGQVSASDPSHYYGTAPGIAIEKRTNGQDADSPPGPLLYAGQPVTWTYAVTNTGNVTLDNVTVSDDKGMAVSCSRSTLIPGESMVCTADGLAVAGQYVNLGIATGSPPGGLPGVTANDLSHYLALTPEPAIDIRKFTNGQDADTSPGVYIPVGQPVVWDYLVTNIGNILLIDIAVTDDAEGAITCPRTSLEVGESMTCQATGTAAAGQYANLGTAAARSSPGGQAVTDSDPSHYFGSVPGLAMAKLTNGQDAGAPPGPYLAAGQPVTWTYLVTNTGNVALADVSVADDRGEAVSCPAPTLAAGASMICQADGIAVAGQYSNVGTASGTPPAGPRVSASDASYYYGAIAALTIQKRTNGQDAPEMPGPYVPVGRPVTWTYQVTNTGNVGLDSVSVTDDQEQPVSCPYTALPAGAAMACTAGGTAAPGQYANLGMASGRPPGGLPVVSASDLSHYYGSAPAIAIEKRTNGQDAGTPPGPYLAVGVPVTWTYVLTNTGNVALSNVHVNDDQGALVSCPVTTLPPGASMICASSGTAVAGQYSNVGTASGTPPAGPRVSASDASYYYGAIAALTIQKRTNGQDAPEMPGPYVPVGRPVTWTYQITNTGNVGLDSVGVTDDQEQPVSCPNTTLPAGAAMACTANGTAAPGQYANLGMASGRPPGGLPIVSASDLSHYYGSAPAIAIEKRTNGQDAGTPPGPYLAVGVPVTWTYVLTNTGNVALSNVHVADDQGALVSCPATTLPPGASMACESHGVSVAGQYANIGTAWGTPPDGTTVFASNVSHYYGISPAIDIEKRSNGQHAGSPPGPYIPAGSAVVWDYVIKNTGNITLTGIAVSDDREGPASCPASTLAAGAVMTCTAGSSALPGPYSNLGTVTGTPPFGEVVSASDSSYYFGALTVLIVEKRTNGHDADLPPGPSLLVAEPVTWTYAITNAGNVPLAGVSVIDDQGVPVSCPAAELLAGETMACTANGTAEPGPYHNLGIVSGTPPGGLASISASDPSHYLGIGPEIAIEKQTNGQDADLPPGPFVLAGRAVTWTYAVTNTGTATLAVISVIDDQAAVISCPGTELAPGKSMACTASGTATPGPYFNLGTAYGTEPGGYSVSASDRSHYMGIAASLAIEIYINGLPADDVPGPTILAGSPLTWTFAVTNTGEVTLTSVMVADGEGSAISCPGDVLLAGEGMLCAVHGMAHSGPITNTAVASGWPPFGLPAVVAVDAAHYFGALPAVTMEKKTQGNEADDPPGPFLTPGEPVSWTYEVTNTGNVALTEVTVTDDQGVAVSCPLAELAAGETMVCTANGIVVQGQYGNVGQVVAFYAGLPVRASDGSHYYGSPPRINVYLPVIVRLAKH